ncbi:MAG: hypothetical protein R2941_23025 [Desulfobacterales bacterium]
MHRKMLYAMNSLKGIRFQFCQLPHRTYYAGSVNEGKMYEFVMASDIMATDGNYYDFPGQGQNPAECGQRWSGEYAGATASSPKISWNLVVSFEETDQQRFTIRLNPVSRSYADFMHNYTDGFFTVKNVVLVKRLISNSAQWNCN